MRDRVLSTFQQSVTLFKQGRMDEVAAGCTLLLQMDPMFDPAKKLLEKTKNPSAPIDVDSLLPTNRADDRARMQQARDAMSSRDYQRVVQLTSDILTEDLLNDEARILGDEAREKIEAAPFVEQFARKADASLAAGNVAAAKMELEKARALDAGHPEVVRLAQAIASGTGAQRAAAPSPSFVVDDRAASGRSSQAADFGFTFEEEKTPAAPAADVSFANFSFDTPTTSDSPFGGFSFDAKPAERAAPSTFDFATASVSASDDDQKKVDQYLADGDRAFSTGDYSAAIDLWSRIFLIDVTNDQASERIERAKGKRREIEQRVENLLASGIASFDRGETAKAHTELSEVLNLDPRNTTAQEYLDRLGETVTEGGARGTARTFNPPSPAPSLDIFDDELPMGVEAPLIPPDPMSAPAPAATTKSGKQKAAPAPKPASDRKLPVTLIAIVLGVIVVAAGGWFAWSKFSGGGGAEVVQSGEGDALIGRARTLAAKGKYDQAIALLGDIKTTDPAHNKALEMIADLQQKKSSSAQLIDGVPAAQYFDQRLATATTAFASGDYSAAKAAFEQALRVQALPPEAKTQYDIATQKASQLDGAKSLFAERKYADAIASLQPLLDQDPTNASIRRMIADAHFNLGATALQEERTGDAVREMDEVLKMNPADELAKRSRELAVRYNGETKDLLYKIYVKYLPMRAG